MRAAAKPGRSLLRWRRKPYGNSTDETVIYTGIQLDYKQVDDRYFVAGSRDEERSLVISDVKSTDAAQFTVHDVSSHQSASVNLVVVGKF